MNLRSFRGQILLNFVSICLSILSSVLLVLAFPDVEISQSGWIALVPLLVATKRKQNKPFSAFLLGWFSGFIFFYITCWWLTFAPVHYAHFSPILAYFLLLVPTLIAGFFFGLFAYAQAKLFSKFGIWAILLAPFLWTATEFLRFQLTGNAWNAIGYSQAFSSSLIQTANFGGVYLVGFLMVAVSSALALVILRRKFSSLIFALLLFVEIVSIVIFSQPKKSVFEKTPEVSALIIAVQPNVPMNDLPFDELRELRQIQFDLSAKTLRDWRTMPEFISTQDSESIPRIIIFPESPMNFMFDNDSELREFLTFFAKRHRASVLFSSIQPASPKQGYFNSAVMINENGEKIAQYDKINLMPFGEFVPIPRWLPFSQSMRDFFGGFQSGEKVELMPFGTAKAGVFICYDSLFPNLTRDFADKNADVLIELTNDGYLGDTPVLRQHLANAVFRAVETNRPVLRVTNVGISAEINEKGEIIDEMESYTEDSRTWAISESFGEKTIYVRFGDWFAWFCLALSGILVFFAFRRKLRQTDVF